MKENVNFRNIERTDVLEKYLNDIKGFKILDPEEEVDLVIKAQNGDIKARHTLGQANQRYIFSFAKKYATRYNVSDLIDVAYEGFDKAITDFDVTKGFRLCTYANYWMSQKLNAYLMGDGLTIKKSNYNKTHSKVNKIRNKFFLENGRNPHTEEIAEELRNQYDVDIKNMCDLYDVNVNSINQIVDDDMSYEETSEFTTVTSSYNSYENEVNSEYNSAFVGIMLDTLSEREQIIIKKLFGIGCEAQTMEDVAEDMNMTKERIRQIKTSVLDKLRNRFNTYSKRVV